MAQSEEDQQQATSVFVKNALQDLITKGPDAAMYRLIEKNLRKRSDFKLARRLYVALTEHVTQVVSNKPPGAHDGLVNAVFSFDFIIKDMSGEELVDADALRDSFAVCALALVSAKATLASPCLHMLIKSLQALSYVCGAKAASTTSFATDSDLQDESQTEVALRNRIIILILKVVKLVPTAAASLAGPLLAENFPHRFRHVNCLRCYVRGVLEVARELPRISSDLVALLVERCLEIDVEIKLDDSGTARLTGSAGKTGGPGGGGEDDSGDESDEDQAFLGFGSPLAVSTGNSVKYVSVTPATSDSKKDLVAPVAVDEMAEKLDMLMLELFEHIDVAMAVVSARRAEDDQRGVREETGRLWHAIHGTFQAKILLTHRSKFVQFLLLRFCALQPDYALIFANGLEKMCVDRMVPHVRRTNAVHFLASFVVRTTALSLTSIAEIATRLLQWAVSQLPTEEEQHRLRAQNKTLCKDSRGGNLAAGLLDPADLCNHRLGVLYSVSQALFYIMCFKGGPFLALDESDAPERQVLVDLMCPTSWLRLCDSPLQPLAYCLERVRVEFLSTSRRLKLLTRDDSYRFGVRSDETLRALSTLAGLDLTTPRSERYPSTPRSALQTSEVAFPHTPINRSASKGQGAAESSCVPIRTPGSAVSIVAMTPKSKQTPRSVTSVSGAGDFNRANPLDSFFPFDPYLLRNSFRFVADIYCDWEPCYEEDEFDYEKAGKVFNSEDSVTEEDSDSDSEEDSEDDGESVGNQSLDFTSHSDLDSGLGTSYGSNAMSVDSAPASPAEPSLLARLDAADSHMQPNSEEYEDDLNFKVDDAPSSYEEYPILEMKRGRAESIGDW